MPVDEEKLQIGLLIASGLLALYAVSMSSYYLSAYSSGSGTTTTNGATQNELTNLKDVDAANITNNQSLLSDGSTFRAAVLNKPTPSQTYTDSAVDTTGIPSGLTLDSFRAIRFGSLVTIKFTLSNSSGDTIPDPLNPVPAMVCTLNDTTLHPTQLVAFSGSTVYSDGSVSNARYLIRRADGADATAPLDKLYLGGYLWDGETATCVMTYFISPVTE